MRSTTTVESNVSSYANSSSASDADSGKGMGRCLHNLKLLRFEIILLLIIAVGIRAAAYHGKDLERDAWQYIGLAENYHGSWSPGEIYQADMEKRNPPLLLMILIAGERLGISAKDLGVVVSVTLGSLTCLGCLLLFRLLWPQHPHIGFFAGFLFATLPRAIDYSASVLRDPGYWCALIFALYFWHRGILRHKMPDMIWTGMCIAFGVLLRKEGLEPLLLIGMETLLLLLIPSWRKKGFADVPIRFLVKSNAVIWITLILLELPFAGFWYHYLAG